MNEYYYYAAEHAADVAGGCSGQAVDGRGRLVCALRCKRSLNMLQKRTHCMMHAQASQVAVGQSGFCV